MKKILFVCLTLLILQQLGFIGDSQPDPLEISQGGVVLYATSWCGYCQKAREYLSKSDIPYKEYDIEKSEEGRRQYNSLKGRGVPVLIVNDTVIHGYSPKKIDQALRKI